MGIRIESEVLYILGILLTIILMITSILVKKRKRKRIFWVREGAIFLLSVYLLLLIGVTLFPVFIQVGEAFRESSIGINLIPFKDIIHKIGNLGAGGFSVAFDIKMLLMNVGGNILLLLPLGILAPVLWKRFRSLKSCFILGVITSLSIEFLQLIEGLLKLGFRAVDIDDLILNVLGIVIGYSLYKIIFKFKFVRNLIINEQQEQRKVV